MQVSPKAFCKICQQLCKFFCADDDAWRRSAEAAHRSSDWGPSLWHACLRLGLPICVTFINDYAEDFSQAVPIVYVLKSAQLLLSTQTARLSLQNARCCCAAPHRSQLRPRTAPSSANSSRMPISRNHLHDLHVALHSLKQ